MRVVLPASESPTTPSFRTGGSRSNTSWMDTFCPFSSAALRRFGEFWNKILLESNFDAGCPVVSVAVGGSTDDQHLQPAVAQIFQRWHQTLAEAIVADGVDAPRADRLATMAVAAIEGAIILCRVQRSTAPLNDVIAEFELLTASATSVDSGEAP